MKVTAALRRLLLVGLALLVLLPFGPAVLADETQTQTDVPDTTTTAKEGNATETNQTTTTAAPAAAAPARASASVYGANIYGPFIRGARDNAVLMRARDSGGPAPAIIAAKEGRGGGGLYYPTGPQGWYENGVGSNYHSAYPYPYDPYLADSQYYSDYGWDHLHEFPTVYGKKDAQMIRPAPIPLGRGHEGIHDKELAVETTENQGPGDTLSNNAGSEPAVAVPGKEEGGEKGYYDGGPDNYYGGGNFGAYVYKGRKGAGIYGNFYGSSYSGYPGYGGYGGPYGGYGGLYGGGGCGGGGYGCGGYYRNLRGSPGDE